MNVSEASRVAQSLQLRYFSYIYTEKLSQRRTHPNKLSTTVIQRALNRYVYKYSLHVWLSAVLVDLSTFVQCSHTVRRMNRILPRRLMLARTNINIEIHACVDLCCRRVFSLVYYRLHSSIQNKHTFSVCLCCLGD